MTPGGGLEAETPTQVTDTGEGEQGERQMGTDAGGRSVEDRSHFEIMLLDTETFLDLPQAVALLQEFDQWHPRTLVTRPRRPSQRATSAIQKATINTGLKSGTVKPRNLRQVTVESTVQDKAVTFLTDGKLQNRSRVRLVL